MQETEAAMVQIAVQEEELPDWGFGAPDVPEVQIQSLFISETPASTTKQDVVMQPTGGHGTG
eukprot:12899950-Prorocentrum_lima.AAC.1